MARATLKYSFLGSLFLQILKIILQFSGVALVQCQPTLEQPYTLIGKIYDLQQKMDDIVEEMKLLENELDLKLNEFHNSTMSNTTQMINTILETSPLGVGKNNPCLIKYHQVEAARLVAEVGISNCWQEQKNYYQLSYTDSADEVKKNVNDYLEKECFSKNCHLEEFEIAKKKSYMLSRIKVFLQIEKEGNFSVPKKFYDLCCKKHLDLLNNNLHEIVERSHKCIYAVKK